MGKEGEWNRSFVLIENDENVKVKKKIISDNFIL